jgi:PAS domain S-box-containing protein
MNPPSQFYSLPHLKRAPNLAEFEALLDLLPQASLVVDQKSKRILLSNAKASELTAYTRNELVGMEFATIFTGLQPSEIWDYIAIDTPSLPLMLSKRNRSELEVQVSQVNLSSQNKWVVITLEPVLHLQQREAERKRREDTLQSMKTINHALHQTDLNIALELMLQAAQQLSGAHVSSIYLQDVASGKEDIQVVQTISSGVTDIFPRNLPAQDLVQLRSPQAWITGKRPTNGIQRAARASNLAYAATAPLGEPSAMIGFIAIAGDNASIGENILPQLEVFADAISALIEQHSRTSNLEETLRALTRQVAVHTAIENTINVAVVVLSPELIVLHMNQAAEATLGYSSREAQGQPVEHILIASESLAPLLKTAGEGVATLNAEDIHLYRRSGQTFLAQLSAIPAQVEGIVYGVIILVQDFSEKEQIQNQAHNLEQLALLGEVTTIFAHEVRNPINNISTGLQLMSYNLPAEDPNQDVITGLKQDCDRLSDMMKSVLAYSRPAEYEMTALNIGSLLNRLLERLRSRMSVSQIQAHLQIDPGTPMVWGNARALEQVFTNLVTNAIQALSDHGGVITIKVRYATTGGGRKYVEIDVVDNGPGIPKEFQDRIFMPFFTTRPTGTGLGLAITKHIITAHKGDIQLSSIPGGTVFQVHLPATEG